MATKVVETCSGAETKQVVGGKRKQCVYLMIFVFTPQQRLHERASILRYTHIACLLFVV